MNVTVNNKKTNPGFNDDAAILKELGLNKTGNDEPNPFEALGFHAPILKALKRQGFENPTAIQEKTIPLALAGKDIIAGSATGSGKTLAFGAGIVQNSKRGNGVQALILTPTRELAEQVAKNLKIFSSYQPVNVVSVYGGVSIDTQIISLKKAEVVVATPGRLLDHINRKTIRLDKVKTLVLDEADTMFDMGFIVDVEKIIKQCPKDRQTLLFSATLTNAINGLAKRHTKGAVKIITKTSVDPDKLSQVYYEVGSKTKFPLLTHLLKNENAELSMVFCNTRRITDQLTKNLRPLGIKAIAVHGGISQHKRTKVIKQFHSKRVNVLVCTDVAARGLDIQGVSHVFNYDIPTDSKQYIHRIGRTARAGKVGKAISMVSKRDKENFTNVLMDNYIDVPLENTPFIQDVKN